MKENSVDCEVVHKISSDLHPNVKEVLKHQPVSLVINTPNKFSHEEISDGYLIRRLAIDQNIPLVTNIQIAKLLAKCLKKYKTIKDLPVFHYEERGDKR